MSLKKSLIVFYIILTPLFSSCRDDIDTVNEEVVVSESRVKWGICIDNYNILDGIINRDEMLSDILIGKVSPVQIYDIDRKSESTYSVRKLRAGKSYHILQTFDSVPRTDYFIYDISPVEYVVYSFTDSIHSYLGAIQTDTVIRSIYGSIDHSLWNAMIKQNASPELAGMLSDIYSWTIDFFGIQPNDSFSVCYQEVYADSVSVGIGHILASNFITAKTDHYAFYYHYRDEKGEYFDQNGTSLRRAFLKAPLQYSRISSRFSNARMHPITKVVRAHHGVDYAAPSGTPVLSVGDGIVTARAWDSKGGGNYIKIKHNGTYTTEYMHLKGFASGISIGTHVTQGQLIGYVGATGLATGPHLDYRVFKNGTAINPLSMDLPAVDPIAQEDMSDYIETVRPYMEMIGLEFSADNISTDTIK